jgi:hypothetical protein
MVGVPEEELLEEELLEEELLEEATAPLLPPLQANRKNGHNRASKTTTLFFIFMLSLL